MENCSLDKLNSAVDSIQMRLSVIEKHLGLTVEKPSASQPKEMPQSPVEAKIAEPKPVSHEWRPEVSTEQTESKFKPKGGQFLAAVAMICFLLAASYLIKLAIDTGWLTPIKQLTGVALIGFSLIGSGLFLQSRDVKYASFLPGTGVVVLYMAVYAGHLYYELIGANAAAMLAGIVSFYSIYLFMMFRNEYFVFSSLGGSYLVPFLIGTYHQTLWAACIYFLFWDICYCFLAVKLRRRAILNTAAYIAVLGFFALYLLDIMSLPRDASSAAAMFQAIQFVVFIAFTVAFSVWNSSPLGRAGSYSLLPVLLIFYGGEYVLLMSLDLPGLPWLGLGFAAVVCCFYLAAKRLMAEQVLESGGMLVTFCAIVFFQAFYLNILPEPLSPWLAILLLAGLPFISKWGLSFERSPLAYGIIILIILIEYIRPLSVVSHDFGDVHLLLLNLIFASFFFLSYFLASNNKSTFDNLPSFLILFLSSVQLLVGLRRAAELFASVANAEFVVSSLWAFAALAMMLLARAVGDKLMARASVCIFAIVAIKVLFSDIASSSSVTRIVSLLIIGALLYAGGYLLRHIDSWEAPKNDAHPVAVS